MTSNLGPSRAGPVRPFNVTHGTVLRIAVPMMLAYLSTPLVGAADTAIVGQLGDAALIGGVAVAAMIFDVVFGTLNFLRGATTGLTAQAFGAGNKAEEQATLLRASGVALVFGLAIVLVQAPIAWIGFAGMGAPPEVTAAGRAYFFVRIWSAPFMLINYVVLGWILGRGEAGTGLLLQTVLNGVNIAVSVWFVLGLGWGVEGAALGTVVAEIVTAVLGVLLVAMRMSGRPIPLLALLLDRNPLRRMVAVNSDMMIRSLVLLLAFGFFTAQGARFGTVTLAANAVLMHFFLVAGYFLDGFATAAEQLAGRAVGARFRPAFERVVQLTLVWGLAAAGIFSGVYLLVGPCLIDMMTTAPDVRTEARQYLPWAALTPLAGVIAFQMDGIFIGATWSRDMRNMMLASALIYVAFWAALTPFLGNHGLWAAFLVFLGARSLTFRWRMRRLLPQTFPSAA